VRPHGTVENDDFFFQDLEETLHSFTLHSSLS
jgi:hypothetical protein